MTVTLESLAEKVRAAIRDGGADARAEEICAAVSEALRDADFIAAHLPDRAAGQGPREVLYEDPELKFCICGHVYAAPGSTPAHDHGSSWAVYGQATGATEMTDWRIVEQGGPDTPKRVVPVRTYAMHPGDAHFYAVGDVHSPKRDMPTRLIRIEGANLDHVQRSWIEPVV